MLREEEIQLESVQKSSLFGEIIGLIQATSDPLSEEGSLMLTADLQALKEAYHVKLIGKKEKKGDYVPLSKIF
jgi:hypothetical protein